MTDSLDPTAGHLDLETLADLDEGLLSPEQATVARAHLDDCALCRDDLAALTSVRELLAADAEDAALAMPDDVATRLHAALAAEPPLAAEAPVAAEPAEPSATAAVTTLPVRPYDRERRRNQWLTGLSVAAVIALFAVGISVLPHSSSSSSKAGSAAATTASVAEVTATATGRNYTRTDLGTQALALIGQATGSAAGAATTAAAASATSAATSGATGSSSSAASAGSSAAPGGTPVATGASASSAPSAAPSKAPSAAPNGGDKSPAGQFNGGPSAATTTAAAAPTTDLLAALRKPGAAQKCLSSYDSGAGAPLAIDFATFDGKPAVIGVFNDTEHAGHYEVIAVGPPNCTLYQFARPTTP